VGEHDEPAEADATRVSGVVGGVDDPDNSDLLRRWSEEEHLETLTPARNWTPLFLAIALVALAAIVALVFRSVLDDGAGDTAASIRGDTADVASVLEQDAPSLDQLTSEVTLPPGPETGLSVVDQGITVVEDRFDPARREGTFAVVIQNPNADWLAQGVQVDVQFLDAARNPVGGDSGFVELVLPNQRVAVASLFFDAPTVPVVDVNVVIDVARWRETEPFEGGFTTSQVTTQAAEFSGVRTSFVLRSNFEEPLTDVGVTAVYRDATGRIVGGSDTFVDLLEPGVDTPVEATLLANIPLDQVTTTELYPTASFGFVPAEG
jgi:hypothetical protein